MPAKKKTATKAKSAAKTARPRAPRQLWAVPREDEPGAFHAFTTEKEAKWVAGGESPVFGPFFAAERNRQD